MRKLLPALSVFLISVSAFAATNCNVTYYFSDFTLRPTAVTKVTLTPLQPFQNYSGTILDSRDVAKVTGTNGSVTFSNVVSGYDYRVTLYLIGGSSPSFTNGFPEGLSGPVNGADYRGMRVGQVFYFAAASTNSGGAGVFVKAGDNTTASTNGNVVTINADVSADEIALIRDSMLTNGATGLNLGGTFTGAHSGTGSNLTHLAAGAIDPASGTIPPGVLGLGNMSEGATLVGQADGTAYWQTGVFQLYSAFLDQWAGVGTNSFVARYVSGMITNNTTGNAATATTAAAVSGSVSNAFIKVDTGTPASSSAYVQTNGWLRGGTNDALSSRLLRRYNVRDFGAYCDATNVTRCTVTSNSTTVTSANGNWTTNHIGLTFSLYRAGLTNVSPTLAGIITNVINSTNIQVSIPAQASMTNRLTMFYGHNDRVAIQTGINFLVSLWPSWDAGGTLVFPGASMVDGVVHDPGNFTNHVNAILYVPDLAPFGQLATSIRFEGPIAFGEREFTTPPDDLNIIGSGIIVAATNLNGAALFACQNYTTRSFVNSGSIDQPISYNSIRVEFEKFTIRLPENGNMTGLDLRGANNVRMNDVLVDCGYALYQCALPVYSNTFGVRMPGSLSAGNSEADNLKIFGHYNGLEIGEHGRYGTVEIGSCLNGVHTGGGGGHFNTFQCIDSECNRNVIYASLAGQSLIANITIENPFSTTWDYGGYLVYGAPGGDGTPGVGGGALSGHITYESYQPTLAEGVAPMQKLGSIPYLSVLHIGGSGQGKMPTWENTFTVPTLVTTNLTLGGDGVGAKIVGIGGHSTGDLEWWPDASRNQVHNIFRDTAGNPLWNWGWYPTTGGNWVRTVKGFAFVPWGGLGYDNTGVCFNTNGSMNVFSNITSGATIQGTNLTANGELTVTGTSTLKGVVANSITLTTNLYFVPLTSAVNSDGDAFVWDNTDSSFSGTANFIKALRAPATSGHRHQWQIPRDKIVGTNFQVIACLFTTTAATTYPYYSGIGWLSDANAAANNASGSLQVALTSANTRYWVTNSWAMTPGLSNNATVWAVFGAGYNFSPSNQVDILDVIVRNW